MSLSNIICIFMHLFTLSAAVNYCDLCEEPGTHTMCLYPTPAMGPDCVSYSKAPLSKSEKESVINMHNIYRNRVAIGGTKLPTASDMRQMYWDDELEIIAQRWMNQCKFEHDKCRDSERFPVGQNIGKISSTKNLRAENHVGVIVRSWYAEIKDCNPSQIDLYEGDSRTGHFTQMIWSRTYLIGCGRVNFTEGNMKGAMMACNYGPAGNVLGEAVYHKGEPCSECPEGTYCSDEYGGLCARSSRHLYIVHLGIMLQAFVFITSQTML